MPSCEHGGELSAAVPLPRSAASCEEYTTARTSVTTRETVATLRHAGSATAHAWLLRDVTHVPGVLTLAGGRLRFVSSRRVVFDAGPDELELDDARARRGVFGVTVDGERLRLSVVRPPGGTAVPDDLVAREAGEVPTRGDHAAIATWRPLLAPSGVGEPEYRRPLRRAFAACFGRTASARRSRTIAPV